MPNDCDSSILLRNELVSGQTASNDGKPDRDESLLVAMATANACTLLDRYYRTADLVQQRCDLKYQVNQPAGRVQLLEMQFDSEGLDIIGLQESRLQESQVISGLVYNMYVSSADKQGCYGAQCWVRVSPKFRVVHWYAHHPRIVEVAVKLRGLKRHTHFISAHAPIEAADSNTKQCFWDKVLAISQSK